MTHAELLTWVDALFPNLHICDAPYCPTDFCAWLAGRAFRLQYGPEPDAGEMEMVTWHDNGWPDWESRSCPSAESMLLYPGDSNARMCWEIGWVDEHCRLVTEEDSK